MNFMCNRNRVCKGVDCFNWHYNAWSHVVILSYQVIVRWPMFEFHLLKHHHVEHGCISAVTSFYSLFFQF